MGMIFSLSVVIVLVLLPWAGVSGANLTYLFGVIIPYLSVVIFFVGLIAKVIGWGKSPVPFRIPTTAGQQKTLPWIKQNKLENPATGCQAVGRMILEICCFRSLFRNISLDFRSGPYIYYGSAKFLWLGAIVFHYAFLTVLIRHLRFFMEPVPAWLNMLDALDGWMDIGLPGLLLSGVVLLLAVLFLFSRRLVIPSVRYISLPSDYFPLFLIMAIAITGILMRYFIKTDIAGVKEMTMGLVSFSPKIIPTVGAIFYIHVFLVSTLFAYFPFSKLMHLGGVFMSPTRNLANTNRYKRHVNPWNYPVKVHTYEAYEDDFREKMVEAGLPVDKPLEPTEEAPSAEEE